MKRLFILFFVFIFTQTIFAAIPAPDVPVGRWTFQNDYHVTNLRMAEVVQSPGPKPSHRVVQLRKDGFQCIHQNPIKYLCTKNIKGAKLNEAQEKYVLKNFADFTMEFLPTNQFPKITFDGSQQTDYFMAQLVNIAGVKYSKYGITAMQSGEIYYKFVSDEENGPNMIFTLHDAQFTLPVILQTTMDGQTWGYFLNILFQN